ncbi:hypothetical protein ATPR_1243 [Acetobacter tropicalis NBRC 101654]|uniref:Uncharacterized protein n=1 Tax=Acetobacter tropicalis NBRC 101654 TaxID=749388 RepID=F7VCZ4_9PROT|nr:hypothetical protein ATPR_1243 [Acetobacter tropicalis NBRC 101654]
MNNNKRTRSPTQKIGGSLTRTRNWAAGFPLPLSSRPFSFLALDRAYYP